MRVLLRRYSTGVFFQDPDSWTKSPSKAFDFVEKERAVKKANELGVRDVDVVVTQEDGTVLFGTRVHQDEAGNGELCGAAAGSSEADITRAPSPEKCPKDLSILVAEDLDSDAQLLRLAFKRAEVTAPLSFVKDGAEAIAYLAGQTDSPKPAPHPIPTMLLLDIKMPRMNGFEVLEWVRCQPGLKRLVVIVLTASDLRVDVNRAYDLGANSYLVKPTGVEGLEHLARSLRQYWVDCNRYPDVVAAA